MTNLVFINIGQDNIVSVNNIVTISNVDSAPIKRIMQEASADSEVKIRLLYNDIIRQSRNVENRWMQAQRDLIRQTTEGNVDEARQKVKGRIEALTQACETLHNA